MVSERDSYLDADDTTVSVTQSLHDAQAPSHDDGDAHEDGRAVLRRGGSGDLTWARGVVRGA